MSERVIKLWPTLTSHGADYLAGLSEDEEAALCDAMERAGIDSGQVLLTAAELAEYLGLSAATVLDRWQAGDLPGFRLFGEKGGPVRFRRSEIEAVLETWRRGPIPSTGIGPREVVE